MARIRINGFETGDFSECAVTTSSMSIDSSIHNANGAYSVKLDNGAGNIEVLSSVNSVHPRIKFYFYYDDNTVPTGAEVFQTEFIHVFDSSSATVMNMVLQYRTDGLFWLLVFDHLANLSAFTSVTAWAVNTWIRFDLDLTVSATVGAFTLYQDGSNIFSASTQNFGSNNADKVDFGGTQLTRAVPGSIWYDDVEVDGAALCNAGYVIARQFKSGTPTYNAWTKSGGTNIEDVWNDTPFSASTNANSSVVNDAQTGLVYAVGSVQTGHGTGTITQGDTINGAKAGLVGKAASGSASSIRYRAGGADTDTAITLTTSDAYFETAVFSDTLSNIATSQVGAVQGANTVSQTVEDAWLMVSYTPTALLPSPMQRVFI